ncbi:hypothetical protein BH11BAC7_BH11BAC7_14960 [soil metagenome]
MKKYCVLILLFLTATLTVSAQKQKITLDDDTIMVDGQQYGILEKKMGVGFHYTVRSMDGKELMYLLFLEFNDPSEINSANPKGNVPYFEVTFLGSGKKCEIPTATKKGLAKMIVENNLLKGNDVDAEAEKRFILINGTKFSEQKQSLQGPKVIIIEK